MFLYCVKLYIIAIIACNNKIEIFELLSKLKKKNMLIEMYPKCNPLMIQLMTNRHKYYYVFVS